MNEPKPFASLTSSLLARKGQAKPAMRPQAYGSPATHEDLGWNDMGQTPAPVAAEQAPDVASQQAAIARELGAVPSPKPAPARARKADIVPIAPAKPALPARAKAAFTLRLDPERRLRLRLACAVDHRSAQQIVTQALDEFLGAKPELDALADKVAAHGKH